MSTSREALERHDFHLGVLGLRLGDDAFEGLGRLVIDPFLAALLADRSWHRSHDDQALAVVHAERGGAHSFLPAAQGTGRVRWRLHGFFLVLKSGSK